MNDSAEKLNSLPESPKQNGGARPGAGRKRKRDKFGTAIQKAENKIADRLPELIDNMLHLANGGYERVEEQYAPAGSLYVGTGPTAFKMYPHLPDDQLMLVKRVVSTADRDRAANQYLIDRIMGKPTERKEHSFPKPLEDMSDDELRAIIEG